MYRSDHNRSKSNQTANPSKYPQGYFKSKECKICNKVFEPKAPSEHYCSDKCKSLGATNAYLGRNYSMTYDDYLSLHDLQNGRCAICNGEGFVLDKKQKLKLVVDHCHKTSKVRGLLCHNCNRALGLFKDDVAIINKAVAYVEGATTISKESTLQADGNGSA